MYKICIYLSFISAAQEVKNTIFQCSTNKYSNDNELEKQLKTHMENAEYSKLPNQPWAKRAMLGVSQYLTSNYTAEPQ
jgi:hypothetical protein